MIFYTLPFFYTHKFNRIGIESWAYIFEYYVALVIFTFLTSSQSVDLLLIGLTLPAYIAIYEIGYIQNNVFAVLLDEKPTQRHSEEERSFLAKHFKKITAFRYFLTLLLIVAISQFVEVWLFVVLLVLTRLIFYLYNMKFRKGLSHRFLFVLLRFLRYGTPLFFLGNVALLFVIPVVLVNFINNYAWYDRSSLHLPRFFGTKLFDAIVYLGFYLYFTLVLHLDTISYIFLYMAVIKIVLFFIVLLRKRLKIGV